MLKYLKDILRLKEFIKNLVVRDLKVRYKRSYLGFLWTMLSPLLMMGVLTLVFSSMFRPGIKHFPIFLLPALLVWNFFSQSTVLCAFSVISNSAIIKKIYVPKVVFPMSIVLSNVVHLILALIPLFLITMIVRGKISVAITFLPVSIFLLVMFSLGIGFIVSVVNAFFRDTANIVEILLTAGFFLTPILYKPSFFPPKIRFILFLNPMYYMVECFRQPIYDGTIPGGVFLLKSAFVAVAILVIGVTFFYKKDNSLYFHI